MGMYLLLSTLFFICGILLLTVGISTYRAAFRYKKNNEAALYNENFKKAIWLMCIGGVLLLITLAMKFVIITS